MHRPENLLLQWHITDRCNARCAHCYQESFGAGELPLDALIEILRQYDDLMDHWKRGVRGHITLAGGEPFVREDLFDLLEELVKRRRYSFAILTNGTLLDRGRVERLAKLKPGFVQVSIEGGEKTHDGLRGEGAYRKSCEALRLLVKNRVPSIISFTAHRGNCREFPAVARLGKLLGVRRVWADRLIPAGSGRAMKELLLTPGETDSFFRTMNRERLKARFDPFTRTEVSMHRALQFLRGGRQRYYCRAGDTLVTVGARGELYPCRRMPIESGNLMETPLKALYFGSPDFIALRDRDRVSGGCEGCGYERDCRGGLKCLSYAVAGTPFRADPGCRIAHA